MSIQIGALFGQIVLEDNFTNVLNNVQSQVVHAGRTLNNFGSAAMSAGTTLSIGLTAPLVAAAAASTSFAVDFDKSMTRVVTLSGVTETQMHSFRDSIMNLAPAVGIGPDALAKGLLKITSAGERGDEAMNILTISAKASAVGLGEVAVVGDAITSIINAYGRENITAARSAEVLFKTVVEGKGEANELAGVLGRVVGVTAEMGVSFEEVGTFLATYTRLGVDASEATTALRGVMMSMLDPTEQSEKALKLAGTSAQELRDSIRKDGLTAAMTELIVSLKGTEGAVAEVFGNVRAMAGILGTVGSQADAAAVILAKLKEETDDLGAAFTRVGETPAFTMDVLKAKLEVLAITVGNILIPAFVTFMDAMKPLIDVAMSVVKWFGEWPVVLQNAAVSFLAVSAAVGPLLFLFGGMAQGIGSLVKLYGMLQVGSIAVTAATTAQTAATVLSSTALVTMATAGEFAEARVYGTGAAMATAGTAATVATPPVFGLATAMGVLQTAILPVTFAIGAMYAAWKIGNLQAVADDMEHLGLVLQGYTIEQATAMVAEHRLIDALVEKEKVILASMGAMDEAKEASRRYAEAQNESGEATVSAADKLRSLHRAAKEFREEALKPLSESTQQMIHDFTLAGQSASEIADILGENEGAVQRVVAAERDRLKGLEDIREAQDLMHESVVNLTEAQEEIVLTYDKLGHSAAKIALAFELNAAAVTRFLEEERKITEITKKSVEETGELYRDLALLKIERSGTATDVQIAQIERWLQNEIAQLDKSDLNWQAHYNAIVETGAFATQSQLIDFEKLNEGSRAQAKEAMDRAKATYEHAIHNARLYKTEKIELLRLEMLATRKAYDEFDLMVVASGQTAAEAMEWVGNGAENAGQNFEYFEGVAVAALNAAAQAAQDAEDHVWRLSHSITFALEELSTFEFERLGGEARLRQIEAGYRQNPGRKAGGSGTTGAFSEADWRAMLEEQRIYEQLKEYLRRRGARETPRTSDSSGRQREEKVNEDDRSGGRSPSGGAGGRYAGSVKDFNIESGAIVMNWPIMTDAKGMDKVFGVLSDAIMQRLRSRGVQL